MMSEKYNIIKIELELNLFQFPKKKGMNKAKIHMYGEKTI